MNNAIFVAVLLIVCLLLTETVQASSQGGGGGDGSCPHHDDAPAHHDSAVCRSEISYVILAVSGTLEEGFELRKNMDYRPYGDDGPGRVNATFLGKALVRGYKSFLDIKNPTWREYTADNNANADNGVVLKTVNPALVPTGCDEHANRYAIYAVDSRQAIIALAGEPRFLSIAADMGLADLTAADDLTFPDIKALASAYSNDIELSGININESSSTSSLSPPPSVDRIAFLTVTSTWLKSTFVPNGIIRESDEEGIITDYPESTGLWSTSILNKYSIHETYPQGCGSNPAGGQVTNVDSAKDYNTCIDAAIRLQEAEYAINYDNGDQVGNFSDFEFCAAGRRSCFDCKKPARYGTDMRTVRFNKVLTACQLEELMVKAGVINHDTGGPKFPLQGCFSSSRESQYNTPPLYNEKSRCPHEHGRRRL